MPKITFFPNNRTITVEEGITILEAALDHDVDMEHECGGTCACSTCVFEAIGGSNRSLSPMEDDEEETLRLCYEERSPDSRLGCQAKVTGDDVKVWIKRNAPY